MKKFFVCLALVSLFATTGCVDKETKATKNEGVESVEVLADKVGTTVDADADAEGTNFVGGLSNTFEQLKKIGK